MNDDCPCCGLSRRGILHPKFSKRFVLAFPTVLPIPYCQVIGIGYDEAYPLWAVSTIDVGGLGWTPEHIGKVSKHAKPGKTPPSLSASQRVEGVSRLFMRGLCCVSHEEGVAHYCSSRDNCSMVRTFFYIRSYLHRLLSALMYPGRTTTAARSSIYTILFSTEAAFRK